MTKRNRNIKNIFIMANQVKTPIQNYFEKVLYGNLAFEIPPLGFFKSRVKKKNRNKPLWSGHTSVIFENASAFIVKRGSCLRVFDIILRQKLIKCPVVS